MKKLSFLPFAIVIAVCAIVISSCMVQSPIEHEVDLFYIYPTRNNSLGINPLNWKTDTTYAGIEQNKGSLATNEKGELVEVPGRADAQFCPEATSPNKISINT